MRGNDNKRSCDDSVISCYDYASDILRFFLVLADYFYWQFAAGPAWLVRLAVNLQLMLLGAFSVPTMLTTLFSYWHRDAVQLRGSLENIFQAFLWNIISRAVGFVVRSIVLVCWFIIAVICLVLSAAALVLFVSWPILVALGVGSAISSVFAG